MSELFITNVKRSGRPRTNFSRGPITKAEINVAYKFVDTMVRERSRFSVLEIQSAMYAITGKIRSTSTICMIVNELLDNPNIGYKPNWFIRQATKLYNLTMNYYEFYRIKTD